MTLTKQEQQDRICDRLSDGVPLREICREDGMPAWRTVYFWKDGEPDFATRFAQARAQGFDAIAEECLAIANTTKAGVETTTKADGVKETKEGDMLGHRKLQIETRLKLLAKWDPKRYGDKVEATHEVGDSITKIVRELVRPKP